MAWEALCRLETVLIDPEALDFRVERRRRDTEPCGGAFRSGDPSAALGKGRFDGLFFMREQHAAKRNALIGTWSRTLQPCLVDCKRICIAQSDGALDHV